MKESFLEFDINKYKYQTYCVIGSSASGKSQFLKYLKEKYSKCVILRNDLLLSRNRVLKMIDKVLLLKPALILIDDLFVYLDKKDKKEIIKKIIKSGVNLVCVSTNIEEILLFEYVIVIKDQNIILEGESLSILNEEKIMKKLGLNLPFIVDLSLQLGYYDLVKQIYLNSDELVDALWK